MATHRQKRKPQLSHDTALRLRAAAAAPVVESLRSDAQQAAAPLGRVIEYVAGHLFDPCLTAAQAFRRAEVHDSHARLRFHSELGLTPATYILEARMQVAAQLIVSTPLSIARLSELVGYGKPESFARAFQRWCGARPTLFRQRWQEIDHPSESTSSFLDRFLHARALNGQLEPARLAKLLKHIRALYPQSARIRSCLGEVEEPAGDTSPQAPTPVDSRVTKSWQLPVLSQPFDLIAVERPKAVEALRRLDELGYDECLQQVRTWRFRSPAFFEALSQRSLEAGRVFRQAAIPWMQLALSSIEGIVADTCTARELGSLRALALARLGTSMRLACDFPTAERMLGLAKAELERSRPDEDAESEVQTLIAALHLSQRRFPQALTCVRRALELHQYCANPRGHVRTLLLHGTILTDMGRPELAATPFREAQETADVLGDLRMVIGAGQNLSVALTLAGSFSEASALIEELKPRAQAMDELDVRSKMDWAYAKVCRSQGHLAHAAKFLLQARSHLEQIGQRGDVAIIAGELALVRLNQGQRTEAKYWAQAALRGMKDLSFAKGSHEVTSMVRAVLEG